MSRRLVVLRSEGTGGCLKLFGHSPERIARISLSMAFSPSIGSELGPLRNFVRCGPHSEVNFQSSGAVRSTAVSFPIANESQTVPESTVTSASSFSSKVAVSSHVENGTLSTGEGILWLCCTLTQQ